MAKTANAPADAGEHKPKKTTNLLPRLSVPLTADKTRLAVESMTDPIKDRLRAVLADPELRAKLSLPDDRPPAPAGESLPDHWDGSVTGILWDAVGKLAIVAALRQGYTPAEAAILEFSEAEKAQLAGPTAAVLDKYFPGGLARYGPEFVLGGSLLVILQGKLFALRRVAAERVAAASPPAGGGTVHHFPPASSSVS